MTRVILKSLTIAGATYTHWQILRLQIDLELRQICLQARGWQSAEAARAARAEASVVIPERVKLADIADVATVEGSTVKETVLGAVASAVIAGGISLKGGELLDLDAEQE